MLQTTSMQPKPTERKRWSRPCVFALDAATQTAMPPKSPAPTESFVTTTYTYYGAGTGFSVGPTSSSP